jgi:hypothetical protein
VPTFSQHDSQLRSNWQTRGEALLLLLCFFLPFIQTAHGALADQEASLPVCCRTHGKHECGKLPAFRSQSSPQKRSVTTTAQLTEKCPWVPGATPSAASPLTLLPNRSSSPLTYSYATLISRDASSPHLPPPTRTNHKRGPPPSSIVA